MTSVDLHRSGTDTYTSQCQICYRILNRFTFIVLINDLVSVGLVVQVIEEPIRNYQYKDHRTYKITVE